MDNTEILNKVYKRVMDGVQRKGGGDPATNEKVKALLAKDQALRKSVADLFVSLNELNDPKAAIEILAEHITIMVEMLNEFKKSAPR